MREITRIYRKIDRISLGGMKNISDYRILIDELVNSGDFQNLLTCLSMYYDINTRELTTVNDIKRNTYSTILYKTKSNLNRHLSKIYKVEGVYQIGLEIYREIDQELIGSIIEVDYSNTEYEYLWKNQEYSNIMKTKKNYLVAVPIFGDPKLFDYENDEKLEDENYLFRFTQAIQFLKE